MSVFSVLFLSLAVRMGCSLFDSTDGHVVPSASRPTIVKTTACEQLIVLNETAPTARSSVVAVMWVTAVI